MNQASSMRLKSTWLLFLGIILLLTICRYALSAEIQGTRRIHLLGNRSIHVEGIGVINANPDLAYFWIGIVQRGSSPSAVTLVVKEKMDHLIQTLKSSGLSDQDIQLQTYAVSPPPEAYIPFTFPPFGTLGKQPRPMFVATKRFRITLHNLKNIDKLWQLAVKEGANQLAGPAFELSNRSQLEHQALDLAMEDAKSNAARMAQSIGANLGDATNVVENSRFNAYNDNYTQIPSTNLDSPISVKREKIEANVSVAKKSFTYFKTDSA